MTCLPTQLTLAAREVLAVVEDTCRTRSVALIHGAAGCGKSALVRWMAGDHRLALGRASIPSTPRSLCASLLEALGYAAAPTAIQGLSLLVDVLAEERIEAVVVDDAHRLASHTLEWLRELLDRAGVGLVLLGPARALGVLAARCPELAERLEQVHEMGAAGPHDVYGLLLAGQTSRRRLAVWRLIETSRALAEQSGGSLRRLLAIWREAREIARARHRAVSAGHVREAAEALPRIA